MLSDTVCSVAPCPFHENLQADAPLPPCTGHAPAALIGWMDLKLKTSAHPAVLLSGKDFPLFIRALEANYVCNGEEVSDEQLDFAETVAAECEEYIIFSGAANKRTADVLVCWARIMETLNQYERINTDKIALFSRCTWQVLLDYYGLDELIECVVSDDADTEIVPAPDEHAPPDEPMVDTILWVSFNTHKFIIGFLRNYLVHQMYKDRSEEYGIGEYGADAVERACVFFREQIEKISTEVDQEMFTKLMYTRRTNWGQFFSLCAGDDTALCTPIILYHNEKCNDVIGDQIMYIKDAIKDMESEAASIAVFAFLRNLTRGMLGMGHVAMCTYQNICRAEPHDLVMTEGYIGFAVEGGENGPDVLVVDVTEPHAGIRLAIEYARTVPEARFMKEALFPGQGVSVDNPFFGADEG